MRIKYHIFFDRRQIMSFGITVLFVIATAEIFASRATEGAWWIATALLTLLMATLSVVVPCLYIMTPTGIHIVYAFGLIRRFIPWNTVRRLDVQYPKGAKHFPYFSDTFAIDGKAQGPTCFFTENEMIRTLRARILLEKYTGLKVEGFLWQDIRDARKNRKEKKERDRRRRQRQERVDRNRRAREAAKREAKRSTDRSVRK